MEAFIFPLLLTLIAFFISVLQVKRHGWLFYTRKRFIKLGKQLRLSKAYILPETEAYGWCLPLHKYSHFMNLRGKVLITDRAIYMTHLDMLPYHLQYGLTLIRKYDSLNTHLCYRYLKIKRAKFKNGILSLFTLPVTNSFEPLIEIHRIPLKQEQKIRELVDYFNSN